MVQNSVSILLTLLIAILGIVETSSGQASTATLIAEIQRAYNDMNFVEAEIKAEAALQNYQNFTIVQLTEVHKILGLIFYSQNKPNESQKHFEAALSLNPSLQLDPLLVSPKILDFFDNTKNAWLQKEQPSDDIIQTRYIMIPDRRPGAGLRSMVLPGWGQIYKSEKSKGQILAGLWGIGLIGSTISHFARKDAEDKYLNETNPAKIDSRFDTFNNLHKLRNSLVLFSAGVWLFSYFDAILKDTSTNPSRTSNLKIATLIPSVTVRGASLTFLVKF